jgi:hypothetical protein
MKLQRRPGRVPTILVEQVERDFLWLDDVLTAEGAERKRAFPNIDCDLLELIERSLGKVEALKFLHFGDSNASEFRCYGKNGTFRAIPLPDPSKSERRVKLRGMCSPENARALQMFLADQSPEEVRPFGRFIRVEYRSDYNPLANRGSPLTEDLLYALFETMAVETSCQTDAAGTIGYLRFSENRSFRSGTMDVLYATRGSMIVRDGEAIAHVFWEGFVGKHPFGELFGAEWTSPSTRSPMSLDEEIAFIEALKALLENSTGGRILFDRSRLEQWRKKTRDDH